MTHSQTRWGTALGSLGSGALALDRITHVVDGSIGRFRFPDALPKFGGVDDAYSMEQDCGDDLKCAALRSRADNFLVIESIFFQRAHQFVGCDEHFPNMHARRGKTGQPHLLHHPDGIFITGSSTVDRIIEEDTARSEHP